MATPTIDTTSQGLNINNLEGLISTVVRQAIVRPTGAITPQNQGTSGFIFDIIGRERAGIESQITDHYLENNTSVQDHIALRPKRFVLRGYVAEINDSAAQVLQAAILGVDRLAIIDAFIPEFTEQATQVYSAIQSAAGQAGTVITQVQNVFDLFTQKNTSATRQQAAFNYFYSMWISRQLFSVETPFGIFENMAIESLEAEQDDETKLVSSFSVTFKEFRVLGNTALLSGALSEQVAGRLASMVASLSDQGLAQGADAPFADITVAFEGSPS